MLARLSVCSSDPFAEGAPAWSFDIELVVGSRTEVMATLSMQAVLLIADSDNAGPLSELCRAIRDANVDDCEAIIGVEFGTD